MKVSKIRIFKIPTILKLVFPNRIWHGDRSEKEVFLTFDDGPHHEITPWLLDFAKKEGLKINFFWLGKNTEVHQDLALQAIEDGHFIANHGFEHLNALKVRNEVYFENFRKGDNDFTFKAFRPPYGRLKNKIASEISRTHRIIMWSWLSFDWDKNVSNEKIIKKLKNQIRNGDILVFHESDKTLNRFFKLLPEVVEVLKTKGLKTASLSKLLN